MRMFDLLLLGVLGTLVGVLFVLAMIEASMLHVRRSAVASMGPDSDRQTSRLLELLDDLTSVMNTVLLSVLLTQVTATAVAGVLAQRWFGETGITIATLAITIILFVYGEAMPKTIAIAEPIRFALRFSGLVRVLHTVLQPAVSALVWIARIQSPAIGRASSVSVVSERELLHLTGEAAQAGEIDASDAELIENSFTLGDLRVDEIMIPIRAVVSVEASTPVDAALLVAIDAGHRRLIVHEGSPDRVNGFVRLRDLAHSVSTGGGATVDALVRPALVVDTNALVIVVLRRMQQGQCHLAVVTNDDHAALGILTVEDIVEMMFGPIDEPDPGVDESNR